MFNYIYFYNQSHIYLLILIEHTYKKQQQQQTDDTEMIIFFFSQSFSGFSDFLLNFFGTLFFFLHSPSLLIQ